MSWDDEEGRKGERVVLSASRHQAEGDAAPQVAAIARHDVTINAFVRALFRTLHYVHLPQRRGVRRAD
jgi:hypothetical protein